MLLARAARKAVVFRRGPSKQVLLLSWDLDKDEIREGQWLKGRIYERRCDLSPSGRRLIYFAGNQKPPYRTWTAVSRPPWLTALALWPKGDTWGGGGLFAGEDWVLLNHGRSEPKLVVPEASRSGKARLPRGMRIGTFEGRGKGEEEPIEFARRERDGWRLVHRGRARERPWPLRGWDLVPPRSLERTSESAGATLSEQLVGIWNTGDSFWRLKYSLSIGTDVRDLGILDWADWDGNGDLLLAREGRLTRIARRFLRTPDAGREIADLRHLRFVSRKAPGSALDW